MKETIENLLTNTQKAYKESILLEHDVLQDILFDMLGDIKKLQEEQKHNIEEDMKSKKKSTKKRYTYEEVKSITKVQIRLAKDEISLEEARQEILNISDRFPVHNLVQYNKHMKDRFNGIGTYGMAIPSNWAKALLEVTNNDTMIIQALREQQRLYREKDGKANQTLDNLLNGLKQSNIEQNFKEYALQTVDNETTVDGYINSLTEDLPLRLDMDNLFHVTNIDILQELYNRCSVNGDLNEWSMSIGHGRPMAAIKKYINFIEEYNNVSKT